MSTSCVWLEDPDIVVLRPVGAVQAEHLSEHAEAKVQLAKKLGYTFTHVDLSETTSLPMETRRVAVKYARIVPSRAVAITGASYHLTVVASAVGRGVDALLKLERPFRFFRSRADAYAWFSEIRARPGFERNPPQPAT